MVLAGCWRSGQTTRVMTCSCRPALVRSGAVMSRPGASVVELGGFPSLWAPLLPSRKRCCKTHDATGSLSGKSNVGSGGNLTHVAPRIAGAEKPVNAAGGDCRMNRQASVPSRMPGSAWRTSPILRSGCCALSSRANLQPSRCRQAGRNSGLNAAAGREDSRFDGTRRARATLPRPGLCARSTCTGRQ